MKNQELRWPAPIMAVAFDMDGLMANTEDLYFEVGQALLGRRGKEFTPEIRRGIMGLPDPESFEYLIRTAKLNDTPADLGRESDDLFVSLLPNRLRPLAGLLELLDWLDQRKLPKCVATSSRLSFAEVVLSGIGVRDRVDFIITAEHVARGKPHPDIYLGAAERLHVQPVNMLVLEDSRNGSLAGVASGACTVAVPGEHSYDHDFSHVFFTANSLADPRIIDCLTAF